MFRRGLIMANVIFAVVFAFVSLCDAKLVQVTQPGIGAVELANEHGVTFPELLKRNPVIAKRQGFAVWLGDWIDVPDGKPSLALTEANAEPKIPANIEWQTAIASKLKEQPPFMTDAEFARQEATCQTFEEGALAEMVGDFLLAVPLKYMEMREKAIVVLASWIPVSGSAIEDEQVEIQTVTTTTFTFLPASQKGTDRLFYTGMFTCLAFCFFFSWEQAAARRNRRNEEMAHQRQLALDLAPTVVLEDSFVEKRTGKRFYIRYPFAITSDGYKIIPFCKVTATGEPVKLKKDSTCLKLIIAASLGKVSKISFDHALFSREIFEGRLKIEVTNSPAIEKDQNIAA